MTYPLRKKNTVEIRIGQRKTHALVDTGSQITLVNRQFFDKTNFVNKPFEQPDFYFIKGVGGRRLTILGKMSVPIQINHEIFTFPIHVVEDLTHSCIIGLDFMDKFRVTINLANNTLSIEDSATVFPLICHDGMVRSTLQVKIPPHHQVDIPVRISRRDHAETFLVEPSDRFEPHRR